MSTLRTTFWNLSISINSFCSLTPGTKMSFTYEVGNDEKSPFLDILVTREDNELLTAYKTSSYTFI